MSLRNAVHLVAMLALGALSFSAFGFLVEWRQDQPVAMAPGLERTGASNPASVLVEGVAAAADASRHHLAEGHRGQAMHAMDAARRAALVGRDAVDGPLGWAFGHAAHQIEEARVDVQVGRPSAARHHLGQAVHTMDDARRFASRADGRIPDADRCDQYDGATVLNALGARLGEISDIECRPQGTVTMVVGGSQAVLGFLDLDGDLAQAPTGLLLYGDPGLVGVLHVVVPTFGDGVDAIAAISG